MQVHSTSEALQLLARGGAARVSHATACNTASSRSHCVVWLGIRGAHAAQGVTCSGALCLVDLAGRCGGGGAVVGGGGRL